MQTPDTRTLPDLQQTTPRVQLPLARAGVTGVRTRALLADGTAAGQSTVLVVDATVDLAPGQRGVHMSRFHESVAAALDAAAATPASLATLARSAAAAAADAQGAHAAEATLTATLLLPDQSPASGRATTLPVDVIATCVTRPGAPARTTLSVTVAGMNACPCAQELVRADALHRLADAGFTPEQAERALAAVPVATHNQRGLATITIGRAGSDAALPDVARLAELAREAMSAHVHELLKREDELHVVRRAHARPRFVEDCVRELLDRAVLDLALDDDDLAWATQVNHESIHAHDVVAEAGGSARDIRAWQQAAAAGGEGETPTSWLDPHAWLHAR
jgi:MptA/FolE2 family GTP cyclohydrolase